MYQKIFFLDPQNGLKDYSNKPPCPTTLETNKNNDMFDKDFRNALLSGESILFGDALTTFDNMK